MPVPHCFDYCSFVVRFEIEKCESSNFVLFQDCFGMWGLLQFHMKFRVTFSISANKGWVFVLSCFGILIRIALDPYISLGSIVILIILSSNPWMQDTFPFVYVAFNFFQPCLSDFSAWDFSLLAQIHLYVLYSFWCYCKGNCFLNFLFRSFIASVKNIADFCVLLLYLQLCRNYLLALKGFFFNLFFGCVGSSLHVFL